MPTAGGKLPIARFDWTPAVLADLQASVSLVRSAVLQRFGERLRCFIQKAGWAEHEREIAHAIAARRPVFLTIRSSAAELYTLPWELLTLKSGQFIGRRMGCLFATSGPRARLPLSTRGRGLRAAHPARLVGGWRCYSLPRSIWRLFHSACAAGFHPFHRTHDVLAHASLGRIIEALAAAQRAASPIAVPISRAMALAPAVPSDCA